ncbi:MAG: FAD-dependent oxidoreductase [Candidatus Tectomicrobia bacterium]|nr:FAD-dependent oxidoreductase [Candidatus Tectomicrobia bacterium]
MVNSGSQKKKRVVILGGGFAGVYTAMYLESMLGNRDDFEIAIVNKENYLVFQPMLAEVVSGNIGILDTVSPIRRLLPRSDLHVRDVEGIDFGNKIVILSPGFRPRPHLVSYDYLVIALGTVTDFRGMPGLHEHALPFKNLADALYLRNHLIHVLEEADIEEDPELRQRLLTFVVAGGGFSGTEVIAELNDFVRHVAKNYRDIDPKQIRVILLHSGERVLDGELSEGLSLYAQSILKKRGVEIRFKTRLAAATPEEAILSSGERIPTKTLISTVPASPNPIIEMLSLPKERGRIKADMSMQVEGHSDIWALGDCALIPNPTGQGFCPPTAQHAIREGKIAAQNIVAAIRGGEKKVFTFKGLGVMGALGHRSAVAQLLGGIKLSGILAWFMWRGIYWWKLPGLDRKIKVGASWLLDLLMPPDLVQLKLGYSQGVAQAHYEPGEVIFRQGDLGDCLYIIMSGEAEVLHEDHGHEHLLAQLGPGDYFGEMALLNQKTRTATIRCLTAMDLLTLRKGDFGMLVTNLPAMRQSFDRIMDKRAEETKKVIAQQDEAKAQEILVDEDENR